jgi:DnaK suppressor protein
VVVTARQITRLPNVEGRTSMTDSSKQEQLLNALRAKDAEVGTELGKRDGLPVEPVPDVFDQMQEEYDRALVIEILGRNSAVRREIRDAIRRIQSGKYGLCLGCGRQIDPKRLTALPWAVRCLRCQENADARNASSSRGGASLDCLPDD